MQFMTRYLSSGRGLLLTENIDHSDTFVYVVQARQKSSVVELPGSPLIAHTHIVSLLSGTGSAYFIRDLFVTCGYY